MAPIGEPIKRLIDDPVNWSLLNGAPIWVGTLTLPTRRNSHMANPKQTSDEVSKLAAQTLRDPNASATAKKLAGSALAQSSSPKQTGKDMEAFASMVLKSPKYSDATKTLAATVVAQSDEQR